MEFSSSSGVVAALLMSALSSQLSPASSAAGFSAFGAGGSTWGSEVNHNARCWELKPAWAQVQPEQAQEQQAVGLGQLQAARRGWRQVRSHSAQRRGLPRWAGPSWWTPAGSGLAEYIKASVGRTSSSWSQDSGAPLVAILTWLLTCGSLTYAIEGHEVFVDNTELVKNNRVGISMSDNISGLKIFFTRT